MFQIQTHPIKGLSGLLRDHRKSANVMKADLGGLLLESEMRKKQDSAKRKRKSTDLKSAWL